MAKFDVQGAINAGYSEAEIADFLAKEQKFDLAGARDAGYSDWEVLGELTKPEPGAIEAGYRGFRRSLGELGVLAGDLVPALAASALLPEEKSRAFVERQLQEAGKTRAELEEAFPTVYGSYKEVEDIGSGIGYVSEKFGELLPDIIPSITTGGIGMFMGKKAAQKAARNTIEEVSSKTERELLEGGLDTATDAALYKNVADRVGREAAEKITQDFVGKGITTGAFLGSFAQNAPEVFENIYEETGDIAPAGAVLFGGLSSMLDSLLPARLLGQFGDYGKAQIMARMLRDSGASPAVWKAVLREGAQAGVQEGMTEAAQEAISVAAEKFYGSNKEFFGPENVDRYLESFFAGLAGGGVMGGVSGVKQGLEEKGIARQLRGIQEPPPPAAPETPITGETPPGGTPPGDTSLDEDVPVDPAILGTSQLDQLGLKSGMRSGTYKGLYGLNMSKPEDVEKAREVATKAQSNKYLSVEQKKKVIDLVNAAIVAAGGTPIDIGPRTRKPGEGAGVPGGPDTGTDTTTTTTSEQSGLDTDVPTFTGTEGGAGAVNPALKGLTDEELEALILENQERKAGDTLPIGDDILSTLLAEKARRIQERAAPKTIEKPELKEAMKPAFAPEKIEQLYEATRKDQKLPAWKKVGEQDSISKDEQLIFEDALSDFGRYLEEGQSIQDVVDSAFEELKNYRKAKGDLRGKKAPAIAAYEINRGAESTYRGVNLPRWNLLPEPLKQAYLDKVKSPKEGTAQYQGPDYETQQAGFDALQEALDKDYPELSRKFDRLEEGVFARGEVERQRQAQQKAEDERYGLNQPLLDDIADAVKKGDLKTVLDYLEKNAKGRPVRSLVTNLNPIGTRDKKVSAYEKTGAFDLVTSRINKIVAGQIKALGLKTKLLYDESFAGIAEYDPRTDTIRVGPRGLQEVALLHELTHAATVNVMFKFLNGRKDELTQQQRDGANRIINLMNLTKKQLNGEFPQAYKNPYEFIAYAMSDPKFQAELQKRKVPQDMIKFTDFPEDENIDESISNAWTSFVRSISQALKLFRRVGKFFRIEGVPNEYFDQSRIKSKKEVEEDLELTDEEIEKLDKETKAKEQDPEYRKLRTKLDKVEKIEFGYVQRKNKLVQNLINEEKKGLKKEEADKITEFSPKIQSNPEYKKAMADIKRQEGNVRQVRNAFEEAGFGDLMPPETKGDIKRGVVVSEDPGYLGNMFLEMTGAFSVILDAPPDGGIPLFSAKPLRIGAPAVGTPDQEANEVLKRLTTKIEDLATNNSAKLGDVIKGLFDRSKREAYGTYLIQKLQNSKIWFNKLQDNLEKTKRLVSVGSQDEINNIATQMERATSLSHSNYLYNIKPLRDEAAALLKKIQEAKGMDERDTLALLHTYIMGLHDYERRRELFYRSVPLDDASEGKRQKIYRELASEKLIKQRMDPATRAQAEARVDQLKQDLVALATDPKNRKYPGVSDAFNNIDSSNYNALGIDKKVADVFLDRYNKDKNKADIDALLAKLKEIEKATMDLNKQANYFQPGVENVIQFYGWKNYFPFKGKPDPSGRTQVFDLSGERLSGDYAQGEYVFTGRQSDADNPVLQVLTEATRAAMRAGHKDVPHAMKNLLRAGIVAGSQKPSKTIKFEDRYSVEFDPKDIKKENAFFVYNNDGSIDIYEVNDPDIRRALKGVFKPETPILDMANSITSFFGQMHTRYNPAFAPMDFVRNLMTYAGLIGAKYGPKAGGEVMSAMAKVIAEGGMHKSLKFTMAYNRGDRAALEKLAKGDSFYKDMLDYYDLGGPVAYVQGLTSTQTLENLAKQVNARGMFGITKENFDNFFDSWMAMFETTSRIAAFRTVRDRLLKEKASKEEADIKAMSFAKDMANFQQVGDLGKGLGALYMFWRPAATGAVRAMQALMPAFDFRAEDKIKEYYKNQTRFGAITEEQANAAVKERLKEIQNARVMGYTLMGAGFFVYMMAYMLAGDDEEERNKVLTDDMARWVRFARFNTGIEVGGRDLVFQLPWGFGPGALASSGAQIASVAMGGQDLMSAAMNIMDAGFESFMPLPVSKIDKTQNPTAWAVDSMAPSALRPLLEFAMNTDGLGRKIYTDRQSRYADSFLGGDNVPAMYNDAARFMFGATDGSVDISPGSMYFFANNYLDGATRAIGTAYNLGNVIAGRKDFDPRTDTLFLDAYLKAPSNYDAVQFSKAENKIKEMEKKLKALEGTPQYADYLAANPMDAQAVDFYNETVNGALRNLRAEANRVRRSDMSPKEKQQMLQFYIKQQNQIKSAFTTALRGMNPDFEGIGEIGEE